MYSVEPNQIDSLSVSYIFIPVCFEPILTRNISGENEPGRGLHPGTRMHGQIGNAILGHYRTLFGQ